jgi:hypothetical protein
VYQRHKPPQEIGANGAPRVCGRDTVAELFLKFDIFGSFLGIGSSAATGKGVLFY